MGVGQGGSYGIVKWLAAPMSRYKPITGTSTYNHFLGIGPLVVRFIGHLVLGTVLSLVFVSILSL